jgi:hypothetical protein
MSQVMVWMIPQSAFVGQQMTDLTDGLLSGRHAVSAGQQKSDGKSLPHCFRFDLPPQTGACRWKMCEALAVAAAEERRRKIESLERRGRADDGSMFVR